MGVRNAADIVLVIDTSSSMQPCINGLRDNITAFVESLRGNANETWDVRIDFVAHRCSKRVHDLRSVAGDGLWDTLYANGREPFFSRDIDAVKRAIAALDTSGGETPLVALDVALDTPWREAREARRVVVFFTDEAHETTDSPATDREKIPALVQKIMALKVMLFLVAPDSPDYEDLAQADGADYQKIPEGGGMGAVDLARVLRQIAKSISASQTPLGAARKFERGLFGQASWGNGVFTGEGA